MISDTFHFKGFHGNPSSCHVLALRYNETMLIVVTETPDNPGTSVTNSWGHPVYLEKSLRQFCEATGNVIFVEHYPEQGQFKEHYDVVEFHPKGPKWRRLTQSEIDDIYLAIGDGLL